MTCFHWKEDLEIGYVGHTNDIITEIGIFCKTCKKQFMFKPTGEAFDDIGVRL